MTLPIQSDAVFGYDYCLVTKPMNQNCRIRVRLLNSGSQRIARITIDA
jgi:hypothetical protein